MSANGSEYPIKLGNLQKAFGHQRVLNGLSLRVRRGETVAVLGRSGGGKSVLLKLIIGLQTPDAGSIQVADQAITDPREGQLNATRNKMGSFFQHAALYDSLTAEDNVAFPLTRHPTIPTADRTHRPRPPRASHGL